MNNIIEVQPTRWDVLRDDIVIGEVWQVDDELHACAFIRGERYEIPLEKGAITHLQNAANAVLHWVTQVRRRATDG
jgi:hypothetical protein